MTAYWCCAAFTLISSLVSLGYSVAAVRENGSGRAVTAEYALSRSVALTSISAVPLFGQRHDWLVAASVAMIVVQAADVIIGARVRDRLKTFGPAATAACNLALLAWYLAG